MKSFSKKEPKYKTNYEKKDFKICQKQHKKNKNI